MTTAVLLEGSAKDRLDDLAPESIHCVAYYLTDLIKLC
jgi:predicted DNA-binding protein